MGSPLKSKLISMYLPNREELSFLLIGICPISQNVKISKCQKMLCKICKMANFKMSNMSQRLNCQKMSKFGRNNKCQNIDGQNGNI